MNIYTLTAYGQLAAFPSSKGTILSRQAFRTREAAEAYIPEFRKIVCEEREDSLKNLLNDGDLTIRINEHVIVDVASPG